MAHYRTALQAVVLSAAFVSALLVQLQTVYSFRDGDDGAIPAGPLIRDKEGNLYGTTIQGGQAGGPYDLGTVFEVTPDGSERVLYTFAGGRDGSYPFGVVRDSSGNLYGSTSVGGGACDCGTIYKLSPDGKKTMLHSFAGGNDGASPAGLLLGRHGILYGFASKGGAQGSGVVFRLTPKGKETVLYAFTGKSDGGHPGGSPIIDSIGNLYGTASDGGARGRGVVFKLSPDLTETVLHSFTGGKDGADPAGPPIGDLQGNLYGTTTHGGPNDAGTVFKISPDGTESVLYAFTGGSDGGNPEAGVVLDSAGNLYGGAYAGAHALGAVFEVDPHGHESVLYSFTGGLDGTDPSYSGLVFDKHGNIFGTTLGGGNTDSGVLFEVMKK
jgi:uncharacterized repeat protein (TIGR03803 family)